MNININQARTESYTLGRVDTLLYPVYLSLDVLKAKPKQKSTNFSIIESYDAQNCLKQK